MFTLKTLKNALRFQGEHFISSILCPSIYSLSVYLFFVRLSILCPSVYSFSIRFFGP